MSGQDGTPQQDAPKDADPGAQTPPEGGTQQGEQGGEDADPPGAEHLGDPGKRALDKMKSERNQAKSEAADWKAKFEALQAKVEGKEAEHQAQLERDRVRAEALAEANQKILKAELRAASVGKLADPADALRFLELDKFEVNEHGDVDSAALTAAVDDLLKEKPYLAAQGARFQGSADGGPRNEHPGKSKQDLIAEAEKNRDFARAIRLREELAAELAAAAAKK